MGKWGDMNSGVIHNLFLNVSVLANFFLAPQQNAKVEKD
jgi:hypothetical protein